MLLKTLLLLTLVDAIRRALDAVAFLFLNVLFDAILETLYLLRSAPSTLRATSVSTTRQGIQRNKNTPVRLEYYRYQQRSYHSEHYGGH